jgi:hypothetical protein
MPRRCVQSISSPGDSSPWLTRWALESWRASRIKRRSSASRSRFAKQSVPSTVGLQPLSPPPLPPLFAPLRSVGGWHTTMRPRFARVRATFSLRPSRRKPRLAPPALFEAPPVRLSPCARTQEMMMSSFSRPWKLSTVEHSTRLQSASVQSWSLRRISSACAL